MTIVAHQLADGPVSWTPDAGDCLLVEGRQCHVLDRGDGPPVVVLHGLGSIAREIALPLLPLARRYRLVIPDRPGYGGSTSLHRAPLRPDEQVTWLRGVLQETGVRRPIIAAHSIASAVALSYALRFPGDVAGLVLIAPFCRPTRPAWMPLLRLALLPFIGRFLRNWIIPALADRFGHSRLAAAFAPDTVPDYLRAMPFRKLVKSETLLTMAAELFGFNRAMIAIRNALRRLAVPTVVLAGEADRTADPELHAAWVARRLPKARLVRLPGVGHMLQHTKPHVVMQAVDDIAHRVGPPGVAAA
jgi:pimeloyl-ACP methyl ester carboxylesterase